MRLSFSCVHGRQVHLTLNSFEIMSLHHITSDNFVVLLENDGQYLSLQFSVSKSKGPFLRFEKEGGCTIKVTCVFNL